MDLRSLKEEHAQKQKKQTAERATLRRRRAAHDEGENTSPSIIGNQYNGKAIGEDPQDEDEEQQQQQESFVSRIGHPWSDNELSAFLNCELLIRLFLFAFFHGYSCKPKHPTQPNHPNLFRSSISSDGLDRSFKTNEKIEL